MDSLIEKNEQITAVQEDERSAKQQDSESPETNMGYDQEFLYELTDQGEVKAEVFDQRSKTWSDELAAIAGELEKLTGTVQVKYPENKKLVSLQTQKDGKES